MESKRDKEEEKKEIDRGMSRLCEKEGKKGEESKYAAQGVREIKRKKKKS